MRESKGTWSVVLTVILGFAVCCWGAARLIELSSLDTSSGVLKYDWELPSVAEVEYPYSYIGEVSEADWEEGYVESKMEEELSKIKAPKYKTGKVPEEEAEMLKPCWVWLKGWYDKAEYSTYEIDEESRTVRIGRWNFELDRENKIVSYSTKVEPSAEEMELLKEAYPDSRLYISEDGDEWVWESIS